MTTHLDATTGLGSAPGAAPSLGSALAPLATLSGHGVSVWLDDLSRDRLITGNLAALMYTRAVVGVTTNPTIFAAAITASDAYAADIRRLAEQGADADEAVRRLTVDDVRAACDLLAGVARRTDGIDGRVSLEVDPRLAHDAQATALQARDLWEAVGRDNLLIKIPATEAGLPAVTACVAEGISVNVTLIFSLQRYRDVMDAYLTGLEYRHDAGMPLSGVESVASFFVSRVDTEVDTRLEALGTPQALALRGRAAVANARLAYQAFEHVVAAPRWQVLAAHGARPQRPLWASTGVKNPAYPPTRYVTELVAPSVVNTMPEATLEAVAALQEVPADTVQAGYEDAAATFAALEAVGVDIDDVTRVLEEQGVKKFADSWEELLAAVDAGLSAGR
jgi:transaldolase